MFELTAEATILILRLALVALLYLFFVLAIVAMRREVRAVAASADVRRRAVEPRLIVLEPGGTSLTPGESLVLRPLTRLGRSGQNTIVLDDAFISSEHAVIAHHDGGWWLQDQGSTNGTVVNDRPIRGEVSLAPGDVIALGDIRLKVAS
ncbi:MAG: FHA domain-containing protein [Chloroflexi bacterium]|nr:FHA domain-containing protein [Chloroflexota bacterium]